MYVLLHRKTHVALPLLLLYILAGKKKLLALSTIFSHITTVSVCDWELNAHFYNATSLKYNALDNGPCHIILTMGRPNQALQRCVQQRERSPRDRALSF